jgi:hypothetical protein
MQITNMLKDEPETDTEESVCCVDGLVRTCVHAYARDFSVWVPMGQNSFFLIAETSVLLRQELAIGPSQFLMTDNLETQSS